jgi:transcriptional regulator with XRE-family HTH domain
LTARIGEYKIEGTLGRSCFLSNIAISGREKGNSMDNLRPGDKLRRLRMRMGVTSREVEQISRKVASEEGNEDFAISHARLIQIENGESTPSIYKLFTLSAVYGVAMTTLLGFYVSLERGQQYHLDAGLPETHLLTTEPFHPFQPLTFPVRFDPSFNIERTSVLSRVVELWGEVPIGLLQQLNIRQGRWGFVGLTDYTMYPLLRPGSLVQIDDQQKPSHGITFRSEHDRPIYFIELRDSYVCSWCELQKHRLLSIPHPLSPVGVREFAYPNDAEIIGRVTAVAARLVNPPADQPAPKPQTM